MYIIVNSTTATARVYNEEDRAAAHQWYLEQKQDREDIVRVYKCKSLKKAMEVKKNGGIF